MRPVLAEGSADLDEAIFLKSVVYLLAYETSCCHGVSDFKNRSYSFLSNFYATIFF